VTLALSWSGGKDSALALRALRAAGSEPALLLTTLTEGYDRISMHGVRGELLHRQAEAVGIPLVEILIPPDCVNDVYEERMRLTFAETPARDVDAVAFGDLFLEDIRAYRESRLAEAGKRAEFPLWRQDTSRLAREFVDTGFEAYLVCVDPRQLDPSFAGRRFDHALLDELPPGVDPSGENGEFHTFVAEGPVFGSRIEVEVAEPIERGGFVFCDVRPVPPGAPERRGGVRILGSWPARRS
jgi:uncharacterized protein (TIGR00290 family)